MLIRSCFVLGLFISATVPLPAQSNGIIGPRASMLLASPVHQDSTPHYLPLYQTYAREGALIGGIPLGLLVGSVAGAFCHDTDSNGSDRNCGIKALEAGVITAGITGMIGAFIGSSFHRVPMIPDSVTGDHGASLALGFAAGGFAAGAITAHGDCVGSCLGETAKGALISAVIGGAVGYAFGSLFPRYLHH